MKRSVNAAGRRLEYTLIQSRRADVLFQALPQAGIRVYAPKYLGLRIVDDMVRQRAAELIDMQRAVEARLEAGRRAHPVSDGSPILVEGRQLTLRLFRGGRVRDEIAGGEYKSALSARALARIRQRLDYYIPRIGRAPGRVAVRDQKTRWGSCSGKGNVNFNWKLIMAPPQVLDYVVIHELCHLYEFNHSPRFWALVERQMPEYAVWKKWLKAHGDDLYL